MERAAGGRSGCFSHQWQSGGDWKVSETAGDLDKVNAGLVRRASDLRASDVCERSEKL